MTGLTDTGKPSIQRRSDSSAGESGAECRWRRERVQLSMGTWAKGVSSVLCPGGKSASQDKTSCSSGHSVSHLQ